MSKNLKSCKVGDKVKLITKKGKFIVPIIRETIYFVECDLTEVPVPFLNKQTKMMFSRCTGLKKGLLKNLEYDSPYIISLKDNNEKQN